MLGVVLSELEWKGRMTSEGGPAKVVGYERL